MIYVYIEFGAVIVFALCIWLIAFGIAGYTVVQKFTKELLMIAAIMVALIFLVNPTVWFINEIVK